ncbi:MAG: hypothetical protein KIT37_08200 [Steroidobacteraceae bacterium]|nr:hypothetical protein [Steroidobacteraceae bacterium]
MTTVVAYLLALTACTRPENTMFEASMNFDLENVEPFLIQAEAALGLGLPVAELAAFARDTPVEAERVRTLRVPFGGTTVPLEFRVFMDDIDAPDLYFFTPSKGLADAIQAELQQFASDRGL